MPSQGQACAGGHEWLNPDDDVVAARPVDAPSQPRTGVAKTQTEFWCIGHWGSGQSGWREIGRGRLADLRQASG